MAVQREWYVRCQDGLCTIGVSDGTVEIAGPGDHVYFTLDPSEGVEFRAAVDKAIEVAESDLRRRRT